MSGAGLLLLLTEGAGRRAEVALEVVASAAALGRPVLVFLKCWPPPDLGLLQALGAEVVACQTVLVEAGVSAETLPAGVTTGGLVGVLAGRDGWQLLLV